MVFYRLPDWIQAPVIPRAPRSLAIYVREVVHEPKEENSVIPSVIPECISNPPCKRRRCHAEAENTLKFKLTSCNVPEMNIEMCETGTIRSLEEYVTRHAHVKGWLSDRVKLSVLVEGKKVQDNNRTLQEMGIRHDYDLGSLGFALSPVKQELPLSSASPIRDVDSTSPITDVGCSMSSYYKPTEKRELSKRRIRQPFSKSEAEALVEGVERFGHGRWVEVKEHAFNDADHRTVVDLKDKWKSLVHTASIPPDQRRGERVPQHLLDRVQAAARKKVLRTNVE